MKQNHKKVAAAAGLTAVSAMAVVGGVFATFTDSDTAAPKVMTAGTVEVEVVEGATWSQSIDNLGIGDTFTKTATIDNTSTLGIKGIRLTSDVVDVPGEFGGNLSDAVTVDISQGAEVLATDVQLSQLAAGYDLVFPTGLAADTDVPLTFSYEVAGAPAAELGDRTAGAREDASNPDNKYQGSSLTVTYTIDAVQRDGMPQA